MTSYNFYYLTIFEIKKVELIIGYCGFDDIQ